MDRRSFFGHAGVAAGGALAGYGAATRGRDQAVGRARYHADHILGTGDSASVWHRYKFIGQPIMDAQLLFWLGLAPTGLTDVGEVLDTATRIRPGDELSWFEQWLATATRVQVYGEQAWAKGHRISAASHFYRAGAYYRAALMRYAVRTDPRLVQATRTGLELHDRALG